LPGILLPDLPLQADGGGQNQRQAELTGLAPAFAVQSRQVSRLDELAAVNTTRSG
jgi:hypothetical protein